MSAWYLLLYDVVPEYLERRVPLREEHLRLVREAQRELIEKQIREGIEQAIKGRHVELEAVLIGNVTLPGAIQAAINDKLEKGQAALKMKYVEDEQKAQGRVKLMQANDEAEQQKIAGQSAAAVATICAVRAVRPAGGALRIRDACSHSAA